MCSQWAALATFAVTILATVAKSLATGWLYNGSYVFPFTATQCEPTNIFYNNTVDGSLYFYDATLSHRLFAFDVPQGIGYLEWICNIPAGIAFRVGFTFTYIVQPGSSSACLGNVTTTYPLLDYYTSYFESYTANPPLPTTPFQTTFYPTAFFPIGEFSTITLNPNLAVTPTTSPPSSSSSATSSMSSPPSSTMSLPSSSSPSPSSTTLLSPKSHSASVAGGVVGAVALVLLILIFELLRRRRRRRLDLARAPSPIDIQPSSISGLETGQLESTNFPSPFRSLGAEFLGGPQQYTYSLSSHYSHETELMSNNPMYVPVTGNPAAHVDPIVGQRSSQRAIIPLEADSALLSQRPHEAPDSGHQASLPDLASPADPQPTSTQFSDAPANMAPETSLPNPTPQLQPPSTAETQDGTLDFASIVGAISRAQLSPHERQVIASVNNRLIEASSASPVSAM